jgi:hypothetical protein
VELEGCEGFVIEQSKRKKSNDAENEDVEWGFPREGFSSVICLRQGAGNKENTFALGDLCWTRRDCEDSSSASQQDDWWPSVVSSVRATDTISTNYLVKRFALCSPRCKTSVLLPFFQHFERLGYNRVKGKHAHSGSEDSRSFEKALDMAMKECGLTSLSHALQMARDICVGAFASVEDSVLQAAECQVEGWSDAEETNQDGFLVRAKRDPLVDFVRGNEHPTALLSGSVVAWCPDSPNTIADNVTSSVFYVGIVLAANLGDELALVRPIRNWHDALSQVSREDSFVVRSCAVGSSIWLRMADLHMISSGAPARVASKFANELLPKRLRDERERLKSSYEEARKKDAAQQPRLLGSLDGDLTLEESRTPSREVEEPSDKFVAHTERAMAAEATPESGQRRKHDGKVIHANAERSDVDEAMVCDDFVPMDTSDYEDADNASIASNTVEVAKHDMAGSVIGVHEEVQLRADADEALTEDVSIRKETNRIEFEAECAQLAVDAVHDDASAIETVADVGKKPPAQSDDVAIANSIF